MSETRLETNSKQKVLETLKKSYNSIKKRPKNYFYSTYLI